MGGGGSSRNFPVSPKRGPDFSGNYRSRSIKLPQLRDIFYINGTPGGYSPVIFFNNINSLQKKNI